MDAEGAQGSVLICKPTSAPMNPICYFASSTADPSTMPINGEPVWTNKSKKRGSKSRQKNATKKIIEVRCDAPTPQEKCDELFTIPSGSDINKTLKDVQDLMNNLQTASLGEVQKPKRVRKRKKGSSDKERKKEQLCEGTSECQQIEVEGTGNEVKDQSIKSGDKQLHALQKQHLQRPKHNKPNVLDKKEASGSKKKSNAKSKSEKETFEDYLTAAEVEKGLKDNSLIAGTIRINPRCYKEAYISSEGDEKDVMIEGLRNRNRALEGDEVVVLINPPGAWKLHTGQRTGKVVYIQDEIHSRSCIGKLPSTIEPGSSYVVFSPRDPRVPRMKICVTDSSLPPGYLEAPAHYLEILFNAKITAWNDATFAEGTIVAEVGRCGDLEVETLAILKENNLDDQPISPMLNIFLPQMPYTIPEEEIAKRLDLRKECIFTIDPVTAKDLDDAVSAKLLDNGNTEVGIHISDVSHFLQYNTLLDHTISKRATTIYLVQRVYHMLPLSLCELCSLTSGEDKLTFSVFVELTPDARVVSHRFHRTVIHSCTKLAYEHAQMVIDNPEKTFGSEDFPEVVNGFSAEDCAATIRQLFKLSVIMRKRRFDTGSLRIDQPKLCFHLDKDTNIPLSSFIYENKESHRLIEEFMLLANMTVAERLYTTYPTLAFLRRHEPPKRNMLKDVQKRLEMYGIHLDITDAGTLHSSMMKYSSSFTNEQDLLRWAVYVILNTFCAKPMLRAEYFCLSEETTEVHHYALNAPYYTHFTSPIRRYADIIVHRLLAASLDLAPQPTWTPHYTKKIAITCNRQKLAAKVAGEQSSLLYLALYLREPVETMAAVIDVKDRSLDVIVRDFGIMLRVYTDPLKAKVQYSNDDNMAQLSIQWSGGNGPTQLVQLFSVVRVQVSRAKDGLKLVGTLLPPLAP